MTDASGMTLYFEKKRRPHEGGIFVIGQQYLELKPGRKEVNPNHYTAHEKCSASKVATARVFRVSPRSPHPPRVPKRAPSPS